MKVGPPIVSPVAQAEAQPVAGAPEQPPATGPAQQFAAAPSGDVLRGAGDALKDALQWGDAPAAPDATPELPRFPADDVLRADTTGGTTKAGETGGANKPNP